MSNLIQTTAARRPVVVESGTGYGVEFNVAAQPQFLEAPVPEGLAGASNYCFSMWVRRRASLGAFVDFPMLFGLTVAGGSTSAGAGLCRTDDVSEGVVVVSTTNAPLARNLSTGDLPLNEWVHIAGVRESGVNARMVVGGVTVDTLVGEIDAMGSNLSDHRVTVGASRTDGLRPVAIEASNLQIWNIALTDQQVQDWCMKRLTGTLPAGLIFYAPL